MLELAPRALLPTKLLRTERGSGVNPITVSQRPQTTRNRFAVGRVVSVGVKVTQWGFVRGEGTLLLWGGIVVYLSPCQHLGAW